MTNKGYIFCLFVICDAGEGIMHKVREFAEEFGGK